MSYLAHKLLSKHNRKAFNCGKAPLDNYIKTQVNQDIKRRLAACFVIVDENEEVKGYYTLSNDGVPMDELPDNVRSKMPKGYGHLPVTLLGRLAVDVKSKGQGLGETLLMDALRRSFDLSDTIASHAIIVDPIDEQAIGFYKKYGFVLLESGRMFLPMNTIKELMS
ncbi:MAG: GNAT family N-acetyltransferase [Chitinophagaceae bacterium]|nr:MAG: GNAT family N-acetyltransferase [Chitinophagaceae bacterium]